MSKFKAGDKVQVTASNAILRGHSCNENIKSGGEYSITDVCHRGEFLLNNLDCGYVDSSMIKLSAPKWSIYNNDLPWEKLSSKQKGKLLLAAHSNIKFINFGCHQPTFNSEVNVYKAIKPEPAKPEPTMEELFDGDWKECFLGDPATFNKRMIVKGWTKPCK